MQQRAALLSPSSPAPQTLATPPLSRRSPAPPPPPPPPPPPALLPLAVARFIMAARSLDLQRPAPVPGLRPGCAAEAARFELGERGNEARAAARRCGCLSVNNEPSGGA